MRINNIMQDTSKCIFHIYIHKHTHTHTHICIYIYIHYDRHMIAKIGL
jgi:hypothetical protein